ncbi:MAG: hypothetical protein R3A13_00580 [Bdellovibrionota bacterium]
MRRIQLKPQSKLQQQKQKTIEFTLDVVLQNDTSCVITARGYKRINKIVATKDLATIDSSQNVNIIAMLKGKKIKFNLDYLLTCGSLNQSIVLPASTITTDSILIKTKGKKKAKGKKAAKAIKKFINKLSVQ